MKYLSNDNNNKKYKILQFNKILIEFEENKLVSVI